MGEFEGVIYMRRFQILSILAAVWALSSCGSSSDSGASLTTSVTLSSGISTSSSAVIDPEAQRAATGDIGQNSASGIESLKYYIESIAICEDLEISGTAFSNPDGCIEVYSNGENSSLSSDDEASAVTAGENARSITNGYVDLMTEAGRASLSNSITVTSSDARSYNWGYVTWAVPIKLTASVELEDGTTLRTSDGTLSVQSSGGTDFVQNLFDGDFASLSEAEEAIVVSSNGGNWFKFQRPLTITASDIESESSFEVDFTFNPAGLVKAYSADAACSTTECNTLVDSSGNQIIAPFLDLSPIPHLASEDVERTTYLADVTDDGNPFQIRLEFYTLSGDSENTIYGVTAASLATDTSTEIIPSFPKLSYINTQENGSLDFLLYDNETKAIEGFEFGEDSTTVQVNCTDNEAEVTGFIPNDCTSNVFDNSVTFTKQ